MTSTKSTIRPFRIEIADSEVDDLHARLARTRWPRDLEGVDGTRGVPTSYLRSLAEYWRDGFDWRAQEQRLNDLPQFTTDIDGQQVHFVHVRSAVPAARPLIMLHGWPSSFVEFLDVIGPLTDPVAHGGRAQDAMHVVIPSLPGYGFSPLSGAGWGDLFRVAGAMAEVMTRLGYDRFLAHGTDAGAGIVGMLPMAAPGRVIATHVSGPSPFPLGPALPLEGLTGGDLDRATRFNAWREDGVGYLHIQATRPQNIAYGLTDSPVAQLAWIVEKFAEWTDPAKRLPEDAVDIDRLLTTVTVYWYGALGWSAAHALYEGMQVYKQFTSAPSARDGGGWEAPPAPPAAASIFAADFSVRAIVDPDGTFASWVEHDSGGHFPAMEVPGLLVKDIRAFFDEQR